ncbi:MAG TPA: dTDP-glucose 4,6-dehydratase [Blastocatellia bacterium]|nr:dTDP-glucose 4,6-dehydratase [Blastocatellia bacterium]HMX29254.1 dTDP-glucose 4,6-dehydratase [Blastocatellia bacterium]HMZ21772.1 dTDP-glucose 4,6-dehydratase [Blastocatellia bacterium]HNG31772.1 dTDP-glucose 4,6-dehydratase [Blastocatellia bacterium]
MQTIIVTGGAGFIGANFVRYALTQTEARLVIVDKLTYAGNLASLESELKDARVQFVQADIADKEAMAAVFRDHQPTGVVNFAAESHVDRSIDDPSPFIETNISGTFVLLEASRKHIAKLSQEQQRAFRFLHVSTDEVYGSLGATGLFAETTPYAPNSPYSASKASADHLVRAWHETFGLPTVITNCSNNYGPLQFPEKLIPLMLLNAMDGKKLPIYGDGGNIRDWLYVEDHCSGILLALQNGRPGEKYNIGGDNERTNLQIVDRICAEVEQVLPAAENPALLAQGKTSYQDLKVFVADRPGHDRRYAIDATKIRTELGWQPAYDFESGLAKTIRWYFENRKWCATVLAGKYERERLGVGA